MKMNALAFRPNLAPHVFTIFAAGLIGGSFLLLFQPVIVKLVQDWANNANYSHGFLIPVISAYLVWLRRSELAELPLKPANIGLACLILSIAVYFVTMVGAEQFTMRLSMLFVLLSLILFVLGYAWLKALFLPVAYLLFMIPLPAIIWNKIAFPLKLFATSAAVAAMKLVNLTVYSEGNIIFLPNTTLEVVDACSGLRSLTSLLALSAAFALVTNHTRFNKIILFLSAVPIAVAVNIVRLTVTAVMARAIGARAAEGFLHEASGLLIFVLAFVLIYFVHIALSHLSPKSAGTQKEPDVVSH